MALYQTEPHAEAYTTTLALFGEMSNLPAIAFFTNFITIRFVQNDLCQGDPMHPKYTATIFAILAAAITSAHYANSPFLGIDFGMLLLQERPGIQFYIGLVIMIVATVLMIEE